MTRDESLRYWEKIREDHENAMVDLRIQADAHEREREKAHATILRILNNQEE